MAEDTQLLHMYVTYHSEEAFAEIVRRHLNLVYSAALRRTGDSHRASDVAQIVFTKLARNAGSLVRHPVLTGWLYTATRTTAIDVIRSERSRRIREQDAQVIDAPPVNSEPAADWDRIRPILDGAMDELAREDRLAILMRFFENRSFTEIGRTLRLSEDAARKRVERSLEKLQHILTRRGISSTASALGLVLIHNSVAAAPAGLAGSVSGAAFSAAPRPSKKAGPAKVIAALLGAACLIAVATRLRNSNRASILGSNEIARSSQSADPSETPSSRGGPANTARKKAMGSAAAAGVPIWQASLSSFTDSEYARAVEAMISSYEKATGYPVVPGLTKRVGLKIDTDSGPQLATPISLVTALFAALQRRGFEVQNIFLVDLSQTQLQNSGFLSAQGSGPALFLGHPVYVLESGQYYRKEWFYTAPRAKKSNPVPGTNGGTGTNSSPNTPQRSYLNVAMFSQADFWINLPTYTDDPVVGVNGALTNETIWNASETSRFLSSSSLGPTAVAEMSAIPELRETHLFTLASLRTYQYYGGPAYDSRYTTSEQYLWLSEDDVILDSLMRDRMNTARNHNGLPSISNQILTLETAEAIGVGSSHTANAKIIPVSF